MINLNKKHELNTNDFSIKKLYYSTQEKNKFLNRYKEFMKKTYNQDISFENYEKIVSSINDINHDLRMIESYKKNDKYDDIDLKGKILLEFRRKIFTSNYSSNDLFNLYLFDFLDNIDFNRYESLLDLTFRENYNLSELLEIFEEVYD